jgi:phosphopantothenoylcysteine decarboxylase/phosphopantothenate--cysteine ligase
MNENMYQNKGTQDNIAKLKKLGYAFIGPREGKLACGDSGMGCLADSDKIIQEMIDRL